MISYGKRGRGLIAALLIATGVPLASPAAVQVTSNSARAAHHRSATSKSDPSQPAKPVAMPFRAGELLSYRVSWSAFSNAASAQLAIPEERNLFGYSTWHFRAQAHTVNPVRSLFSVDDQFDSYTDQTSLDTRQYEAHLDELGRVEDQVFHFLAPGQPSRLPTPSVVVPAGTLDPLGMLYVLRHVDWDHTPEFRGAVFDGRDLYEITATRLAAADKVATAAGTYSASKVSIDPFERQKPVPGVHLVVWIADDASRTPVLIEAQLPIGSLRAELTSASHQ